MTLKPIFQLDGKQLYLTFVAGAQKILENQSEINKINVFPVADKDTGTNLASTVRAILDNTLVESSFKITSEKMAEAALLGARGNSGIIFAQFLYGISKEAKNDAQISVADFAESVKKSIAYIYQSVSKPVEGTMLTVMKEWAEFIYEKRFAFKNFNDLLMESVEIVRTSLKETTKKLEILSKSNVVDAGAKGFSLFIEGIHEMIMTGNIRKVLSEINRQEIYIHSEENTQEVIDYRFCTEALIKQSTLKSEDLKSLLQEFGDSIVVAGSEKTQRIHIHTNNPAEVFSKIQKSGIITHQKVDDMLRQNQVLVNRKWKIALVTDSTCDLSEDIMEKYQIHSLPLNINFGENHYLDKITMTPLQFYDLLDKTNEFPKTSQINERSFTNIYSHLASHYDAIISVHLSSQFSGTYLSSKKAAEKIQREFNKPILTLDSKNLSGALGLIVLRIAQAIENGLSFEEITKLSGTWIQNSKIFVSVKTMKYMVMGGRVSQTKGVISRLLNIKPIVSMDEMGKSILFGKAFSQSSNIKKVIKHIAKLQANQGISDYIVLHAQNEKIADVYVSEMRKLCGKEPICVVNISPVIGMNAGIGTAAVSLILND